MRRLWQTVYPKQQKSILFRYLHKGCPAETATGVYAKKEGGMLAFELF
jgi:hypothetical protein